MKTIQVQLYKYDELSPEAQEKARDWFTEDLDYTDFDDCKKSLISFLTAFDSSLLNYSVGPFASSEVSVEDAGGCYGVCYYEAQDEDEEDHACGLLHRIIRDRFSRLPKEQMWIDGVIRSAITEYLRTRRYPIYRLTIEEVDEEFRELVTYVSNEWLTAVQRNWESQYEEEYVAENIRCNDYEFTADGQTVKILEEPYGGLENEINDMKNETQTSQPMG